MDLGPTIPHHTHGGHELVAENQIDAGRDGHTRIARLQAATCQMQRDQAARAGRVYGDAGTLQIVEIGDAVRHHGARLPGIGALVHRHAFRVAQQQIGIIGAEGSYEAGGFTAHDLGEGEAPFASG